LFGKTMRVNKSLNILILGLTLINLWVTAQAARVENLYQAAVAVDSRLENERQKALPVAMTQVLIKVSGNTRVEHNRIIANQLPQAARYVQKFLYSKPLDNGKIMLVIDFNAKAIDDLLLAAGIAKWSEQRPLILVWLASEQDGKKATVEEAEGFGRMLKLAAEQVGLSIMFPAYDLDDMQQVSLSDIWSPNLDPIIKCAQRYSADKLLVGRVVKGAMQTWSAQWQFGSGQEWHTLMSNGDNLDDVMQQSMRQVLAQLRGTNEQPITEQAAKTYTNVQLNINGVTGLVDYQRVLSYLQKLPGVHSVQVLNVGADQIALNISTDGTKDALLRDISQTDMLAVSARAGLLEYELKS
jgi:hypothetical protein